jgi:NAD(P)H-nitrite reductase large subunit
MKHIVIVGNNLAGAKTIEALRAKDSQVEITLISFDRYLPYKADLFAGFLKKDVSLNQIQYRPKDFYAQHNVRLMLDQTITRINVKRKKITFDTKETLDYDYLILTDLPDYKLPDIKGNNKLGVYTLRHLKDIEEIQKYMVVADTVILETTSLRGIEIASSLTKYQKEIVCIIAENSPLGTLLGEDLMNALASHLEAKGIRILRDNAIVEVLGESDVKAVRLKSGKVLAASMVIFGKTTENFKIFGDSFGELGSRLSVNAQNVTSIEGTFALGQLAETAMLNSAFNEFTPDCLLEFEGENVGRYLTGEGLLVSRECPFVTFSVGDWEINLLGHFMIPSTAQMFQKFNPTTQQFIKIFVEAGIVVAAVMVNAKEDFGRITKIIQEKISCQGQEEQLLGQLSVTSQSESVPTVAS